MKSIAILMLVIATAVAPTQALTRLLLRINSTPTEMTLDQPSMLEMAARQRSLAIVTCRLRLAQCTKLLTKRICQNTSEAFYLWARQMADDIMNTGNITCL